MEILGRLLDLVGLIELVNLGDLGNWVDLGDQEDLGDLQDVGDLVGFIGLGDLGDCWDQRHSKDLQICCVSCSVSLSQTAISSWDACAFKFKYHCYQTSYFQS